VDSVHHPWIGRCAVVFTGPPWTSSRREQRARRSSTGRVVLRETPQREWGKEGEGLRDPHRRQMAVVRGARWEGNTGADGASRCEDWDRGVETVL
jgi:hypothetical protein